MEAYLKSVTVQDVLKENPTTPVTINETQRVFEALGKLAQHDILAMPVLNDNKVVGLIDIIDIMTALLSAGISAEIVEQLSPNPPSFSEFVTELEGQLRSQTTVKDIIGASERDLWATVIGNDSLFAVVKQMTSQKPIHRVMIINDQGELQGVISQFGVLQFLQKHLQELFPDLLKKEFKIDLSGEVIVCNENDTVCNCMSILYDNRISGAPVVDNSGNVVGCFSATDVKVKFVRLVLI